MPPFTPWNSEGFIPPIGSIDSTSPNRSPYAVSLREIVEDFGHTPTRRRLLNGFLDYRAELHQAGLERGFQWINGSFLENIEDNEQRTPDDIDVTTFFYLPNGFTEETFYRDHGSLFDKGNIKVIYRVDTQPVLLDPNQMDYVIKNVIYWYSIWSHTRPPRFRWKGYLQVDLAKDGDLIARDELNRIASEGERQ